MAQDDSNNLPPPPPPMQGANNLSTAPETMPASARPSQPQQAPQPAAPQPQTPPTPQPSPSPQQSMPQGQPSSASQEISTEEYVEAIIEERWTDIEEDIRKIIEWKNRSEQRITQLNQSFTDLKERFDKLHAALIGKIENYDKNILEVGAEIKAMEKVFSKVLPTFTDNVKQLDSITKKLSEK